MIALQSGLVALLTGCLVTAACGQHDIVMVELPAPIDGGEPVDVKCVTDADCKDDGFCARTSCAAVAGICERKPNFCDAALAPSCGCEGTTFWNDCLRKVAGVTSHTAGECTRSTPSCDARRLCNAPGADCARLFSKADQCTLADGGQCWVLPQICPLNVGPKWSACGPGFETCVDACSAIRSGKGYHLAKGPACP